MIDIHSHILFGVDDGAESFGKSVELLYRASLYGTRKIVLTPHCNIPLSYMNYWNDELSSRFEELKNAVIENNIDIELLPGQEIFCLDNTFDLLQSGELIAINNSRYILVEFDFHEHSSNVYPRLEKLICNGYVPVIAHPERYGFIQENSSSLSIMKGIGCLFQINKDSLFGTFGREAKIVADYMIKKEFADFVASDCHNIHMRSPNLQEAYEYISDKYSPNYADYLLIDNPNALINNEIITS